MPKLNRWLAWTPVVISAFAFFLSYHSYNRTISSEILIAEIRSTQKAQELLSLVSEEERLRKWLDIDVNVCLILNLPTSIPNNSRDAAMQAICTSEHRVNAQWDREMGVLYRDLEKIKNNIPLLEEKIGAYNRRIKELHISSQKLEKYIREKDPVFYETSREVARALTEIETYSNPD